jgi:hypothetical protein
MRVTFRPIHTVHLFSCQYLIYLEAFQLAQPSTFIHADNALSLVDP